MLNGFTLTHDLEQLAATKILNLMIDMVSLETCFHK